MTSSKLNNIHLTILAVFLSSTVAAETPSRIAHSKELMGGAYKKSVVQKSEKIQNVSAFVQAVSRRFLPKSFSGQAQKIAATLVREAEKHDLDPVFLLAMIQNESSFNPKMVGSAGEIGLMQIKPATAQWIAKTNHLPYKGKSSLFDPVSNIKLGVALLDHLRSQFDSSSRLYVSAYNIGAKRLRDLLSQKIIPKEYVKAVMKRYLAIYSALSEEKDPKNQGEVAWMKVNQLTRSFAEN